MAWFRKEKKTRQPRRERLEIPPDTWEKCEACGHTDIRDNFLRNVNVCPECDFHRRLRAWDYAGMLFDEGTILEVGNELRSVDPLGFPDYPARLRRAVTNAGDTDAILTVTGLLEGSPVGIGVMDFAFMGGSMGSVVGEKIARLGQRSLEKKHPLVIISASGGAQNAGGSSIADADGQGRCRAVSTCRASHPVHFGTDKPNNRRSERELCDAG